MQAKRQKNINTFRVQWKTKKKEEIARNIWEQIKESTKTQNFKLTLEILREGKLTQLHCEKFTKYLHTSIRENIKEEKDHIEKHIQVLQLLTNKYSNNLLEQTDIQPYEQCLIRNLIQWLCCKISKDINYALNSMIDWQNLDTDKIPQDIYNWLWDFDLLVDQNNLRLKQQNILKNQQQEDVQIDGPMRHLQLNQEEQKHEENSINQSENQNPLINLLNQELRQQANMQQQQLEQNLQEYNNHNVLRRQSNRENMEEVPQVNQYLDQQPKNNSNSNLRSNRFISRQNNREKSRKKKQQKHKLRIKNAQQHIVDLDMSQHLPGYLMLYYLVAETKLETFDQYNKKLLDDQFCTKNNILNRQVLAPYTFEKQMSKLNRPLPPLMDDYKKKNNQKQQVKQEQQKEVKKEEHKRFQRVVNQGAKREEHHREVKRENQREVKQQVGVLRKEQREEKQEVKKQEVKREARQQVKREEKQEMNREEDIEI